MTSVVRSSSGQLWALLAASYVSWFGNGITLVAVPLYVLERTGSTMAAGVAGAANALPLVIAGVAGGVLVDRWGAQRASIVADGLAGLCTLAVPVAAAIEAVPFAAIVALLFLRSLCGTPANVARVAMLPVLADAAGMSRQAANTIYQLAPRVALVAGPALAGVLVALVGPSLTLVADAMSFLLAAVLMAGLVRQAGAAEERKPAPFLREMLSGFGFIRSRPGLLTLMLAIAAMNFIDEAFVPVLMPVYSRDVLGDVAKVGWLLGAMGMGAVGGTLLFLALGRVLARRHWAIFMACLCVAAATRLGLVALPGLEGACAILFVFGLTSGPLNPIISTVVQEAAPPELRGRVFGVMSGVAFAVAPPGVLAGGWVVSQWGLAAGLAGCAGLFAVLAVVAMGSGRLRRLMA